MQLGTETKNKRVLLVVGKMGHGKSSFVRSLVLPKCVNPFTTSIAIPETSSGFKSVTVKPCIYTADPSHNLTSDNQPVYLIDTEGLDSDTSVSLIVEQIDEIIKQHQLNIIGIAFVVNLNSGRFIGANNSSIVLKFLQILKIRRIHIEDLLFFVVTNWKICIENEQTEEKIQALKQIVIHSQLNLNILNKTIYWESGPGTTKGFSKFAEQYLSGVGKQQVQRQFGILKSSLTNHIQKSLSYSQYVSDSQRFWTRLGESLKRCYQEKKNYSFLQQNLDLTFNMKQINNFEAKGLAKKGLKTGIDYTASTLAKGVMNQENKVKTKIGQMAKKADFVASIAKRFLSFMPKQVTNLIDSASEMANQMINIIDEEGLQIEENEDAFDLWDLPTALASMSLIIYSTHQYREEKKTKVLSPTETINLQQMQRCKLKDKMNLMQRSMIEANLHSKIFYKNGQIILKEKINSVESIKVHLDESEDNLAELTTQKSVKIISNQEIAGVKLSIFAWYFTFESFDQIYKKQIAEFYSA